MSTKEPKNVHFSSATDEWPTPQGFFNQLSDSYGPFDLDPCAGTGNAKADKYFSKEDDGLAQLWQGRVFMNPPYGQGIDLWIRKAYESSLFGATVVCLVPARTDTGWWQGYVIPYGEVRFIKGRLKFGTATNSAPFPSAVVVFRPRFE